METDKIIDREKDSLTLCKAVLSMSPEFWDNPNGAYENKCPFCFVIEERGVKDMYASMAEIKHKTDCAYLIAKDLTAGLI